MENNYTKSIPEKVATNRNTVFIDFFQVTTMNNESFSIKYYEIYIMKECLYSSCFNFIKRTEKSREFECSLQLLLIFSYHQKI